MERVHLSLAVVALLVLAGCTGGGAAPSTTVETTEETTTPESAQIDEVETTESTTKDESTVLVDEDGLVRYFREEIVYERDGNRMTDVRTVRYVDVNATDVSRPHWLDEFEVDDDEDENE